ncbi:MAG TPA: hypothetical protein VFM18_17165 [Methanosarcina sp.]|nr:hypothetical protein [Methanosarcina sp.]
MTARLRVIWQNHRDEHKDDFEEFVTNRYGITIHLRGATGNRVLDGWTIVDDQKYFLFLLETA